MAAKTGLRWEKSYIFSSLKTLVAGSAQVLWQSSLTGANQLSQVSVSVDPTEFWVLEMP